MRSLRAPAPRLPDLAAADRLADVLAPDANRAGSAMQNLALAYQLKCDELANAERRIRDLETARAFEGAAGCCRKLETVRDLRDEQQFTWSDIDASERGLYDHEDGPEPDGDVTLGLPWGGHL